jgi:predicted kinase
VLFAGKWRCGKPRAHRASRTANAGEPVILDTAMGWKTQRRRGAETQRAQRNGKNPLHHRLPHQVNIFGAAMTP